MIHSVLSEFAMYPSGQLRGIFSSITGAGVGVGTGTGTGTGSATQADLAAFTLKPGPQRTQKSLVVVVPPAQAQPASMVQLADQPSPGVELVSSHSSTVSLNPFAHVVIQVGLPW